MKRVSMMVAAGVLAVGLVGCSAQDQAKFTAGVEKFSTGAEAALPKIEAACAGLLRMTAIAEYIPAVGSVVPWVNSACKAGAGLAKLAANADESLVWLGELRGKVQAGAAAAGLKIRD